MKVLLLSDINSEHTQKWALSLAASGIEHTRVRFAYTIDDAVRAAHDPPRPAKERGE